jgi:putative flippase GtrA
MKKLKQIFNPENRGFYKRYILISVVSYTFVFGALKLLVDVVGLNESYSFVLVYGVNYLLLYSVQLRYLFKTEHHRRKLIRFVSSILFFYLFVNLLFNLGLMLGLDYLVATACTIVILMPIRFVVLKHFVYK